MFITVRGEKIFVTFLSDYFIFEDHFVESIKDKLLYDRSYYVLIRIRYQGDLYKMAGKQFVFIHTKDVENSLRNLFSLVVQRVEILMEKYQMDHNNLLFVQLIFTPFDRRILSDLKYDNSFNFKNQPVALKKDILYFPLSNNPDDLGIKLYVEYNTDHVTLIKGCHHTFETKEVKIYSSDRESDSIIFNPKTIFYYRDVVNPNYILAILEKDDNTFIKEAYDLNGYLLDRIEDKINESGTIRVTNNDTIFLNEDNKIFLKKRELSLKPIKKTQKYLHKNELVGDQKIGVFDLEVYKDTQKNKEFVYAAGLFTTFSTTEPIIFYINKQTRDSYDVIYRLVTEMFRDRHNGIT
jgi:hypothetical protein